MTLSAQTVLHVERLLLRGTGFRQIAKILDHRVSKSTVAKIARGAYHPKTTKPADTYEHRPPAVIGKCPDCYYLVELPCRICAARRLRHALRLHRLARRRRPRQK